MNLKSLAHAAQQALNSHVATGVRRSHTRELLAAALGYGSWAAFHSDALLTDAGVGSSPCDGQVRVIGRTVQLQYRQEQAVAMARVLLDFVAEHRLAFLRRTDLAEMLMPSQGPRAEREVHRGDEDEYEDDEYEDDEYEDDPTEVSADRSLTSSPLLRSTLLVHSLEQMAASSDPFAHHMLAVLHRCQRPKPLLVREIAQGQGVVGDRAVLGPRLSAA